MLTKAQHRTLTFITSFVAEMDYAPTIAEIAAGIGIKSRSTVHRHLQGIEQAGFIRIIANKRRNIELISQRALCVSDLSLPVIGKIAAGLPIEAIVDNEMIDIAALCLGSDRYVLKVEGNSMIGDCICDGDYVICERSDVARNGDIVVALIDQEEATLKRFFQNEDKTITLMPSNLGLKPMVYEEERVSVQGLFIGLLRVGC